jgi:probable HAF family extracellular repeat protein
MKKLSCRILGIVCGIALFSSTLRAETGYFYQQLDLDGGFCIANDINDKGQVVGLSEKSAHFTFLKNTAVPNSPMQDLGILRPFAINNKGQVVGDYYSPSNPGPGFYSAIKDTATNSPMQPLGYVNPTNWPLWAFGSGFFSTATDINNNGQVVGVGNFNVGPSLFLKNTAEPNSQMQGIGNGVLDVSLYGNYPAINDNGQLVGTYTNYGNTITSVAFLKNTLVPNSPFQDLGNLGGGSSAASGINNKGQVVGISNTGNGWHAFLKNTAVPNSPMQDLGILNGTNSAAAAINDKGQVVGNASTLGQESPHAFIVNTAVPNSPMQDLNTIVCNLPAGNTLQSASAINNKGQIVGQVSGTFSSTAYALTPFERQVLYLDFGADKEASYYSIKYEKPAFDRSVGFTDRVTNMVAAYYKDYGVLVTKEKPKDGLYSTVFIGGGVPENLNAVFKEENPAFDRNLINGRAETLDYGNRLRNDNALVFTENQNSSKALTEAGLAQVIAHESGHLFGLLHAGDKANLMYPFSDMNSNANGTLFNKAWLKEIRGFTVDNKNQRVNLDYAAELTANLCGVGKSRLEDSFSRDVDIAMLDSTMYHTRLGVLPPADDVGISFLDLGD